MVLGFDVSLLGAGIIAFIAVAVIATHNFNANLALFFLSFGLIELLRNKKKKKTQNGKPKERERERGQHSRHVCVSVSLYFIDTCYCLI